MADYSYPSTDLEQSQKLLAPLGSHWYATYQGSELVGRYLLARAQEDLQAFSTLQEAVEVVSRVNAPLFHTDKWYLLTLNESDVNRQPLRYGAGAVYGNQPATGIQYQYGGLVTNIYGGFEFPLPEGMVDCSMAFNRIDGPSVVYSSGVDFRVTDYGTIVFRENPFELDEFIKEEIYVGPNPTDRSTTIWLFNAKFDKDYIYRHFGFLLSYQKDTSQEYKDVVNAILDAYSEGTTERATENLLAAMTGVPVVESNDEVVELVQVDEGHLVVATTDNVYKFKSNSTAVVAEGDLLSAGDQLVDTVTFYNLNRGVVPDGMATLTLDAGFVPPSFEGGLTFCNEDVPLVVTSDSGKTRVEFDIGGFPTDVADFWDLVHQRGLDSGISLANYLDVRGTSPPEEPGAASLPSTVNPLEFLIENILRFNAFIVEIKVEQLNSQVGLCDTYLFRKIIPPWTKMILLLNLTCEGDEIEPVEWSESPACTDSYATFTEAATPAFVTDGDPAIMLVGATCM